MHFFLNGYQHGFQFISLLIYMMLFISFADESSIYIYIYIYTHTHTYKLVSFTVASVDQ
uniref:Uncharacterized protein n=1 Tax=Octopus bimaculoides TaxID=37653 RepID=A0A0L8FH60_OCTBM